MTVVYRSAGEQITALDGVALDVASGEAVVIAGPSGSGKSTMLRLLAGFDQPSAGTVMVDGVELSALGEARRRRFRRGRLAVVHQRPLNNLIGDLTAAQHVDLAGRVRRRRTPADVLARFGLGERRDALPRHLSGGEQQRLAIAMAVASGVSVVLADEPTAELDLGPRPGGDRRAGRGPGRRRCHRGDGLARRRRRRGVRAGRADV